MGATTDVNHNYLFTIFAFDTTSFTVGGETRPITHNNIQQRFTEGAYLDRFNGGGPPLQTYAENPPTTIDLTLVNGATTTSPTILGLAQYSIYCCKGSE